MANCRPRSRSWSRPPWRAPIIFNSPHSGSVYPPEFLNASRIDLAALRRSEDSFMDELIGGLSDRGFPVVRVNFPRSYVDVNREPYELDPRMFSGRLPSFANTRSMRVAGGLGTIPRVVGDGQEIYRERLAVDDGLARIEALYKPYHRALRRLINKAHQAFAIDLLSIANHARDGSEAAGHPHRSRIGKTRKPSREHARIELVGLTIDVDIRAGKIDSNRRKAELAHSADQLVHERVLGAAKRGDIDPRGLQEFGRIDRSGMRRVEDDRRAPGLRLRDLEWRRQFADRLGHPRGGP